MYRPRVIPCLLLQSGGLVKTVKFKDPTYVGDPLNAIKIFNEKEVDELIFLDISATVEQTMPNFNILDQIASECFMPVCYGGGIRSLETMKRIYGIGIEKISISNYAVENPSFVKEAAREFGSQSVVVSIDVKKNIWGTYEVITHNGRKRRKIDPVSFGVTMEEMGAGELLINSVDKDGTMSGYDIQLMSEITRNVNVPVIACGGAGTMNDIRAVLREAGASSAAAGSLFVFHGKHRAVLINYPSSKDMDTLSIH